MRHCNNQLSLVGCTCRHTLGPAARCSSAAVQQCSSAAVRQWGHDPLRMATQLPPVSQNAHAEQRCVAQVACKIRCAGPDPPV